MRILGPDPAAIELAAAEIRAGKLVVMPTETVYGLACDALNEDAVRSVFAAKKRPVENPLIVHVASIDQALEVAASMSAEARLLAEHFWPGPLTLVLPKLPTVSDLVTAGLATVAVRIPSHPVALRLIHAAGCPLAAPSANEFMQLSPTRPEDFSVAIGAKASLILNGGPAEFGIESTVVDCTSHPAILRPGGITRQQIENALGHALADPSQDLHKSPGQYARHYAPKTPIRMVAKLGLGQHGIPLKATATDYATSLYHLLSVFDQMGLDEILIEQPPDTYEWEAVHDRLRKAAGK